MILNKNNFAEHAKTRGQFFVVKGEAIIICQFFLYPEQREDIHFFFVGNDRYCFVEDTKNCNCSQINAGHASTTWVECEKILGEILREKIKNLGQLYPNLGVKIQPKYTVALTKKDVEKLTDQGRHQDDYET